MTSEQPTEPQATTPADPRSSAATQTLEHGALFSESASSTYLQRWDAVQTRFVDEPAASVREADALVADVIDELTQTFREERDTLERQWSGDREASTEDLRIALQRYRSFFQRLLSR